MVRAVERGMLRRTEDDIPHPGLDEKSSEKGHTYVSILTDIDRWRAALGTDTVSDARIGARAACEIAEANNYNESRC
jgi:hypothetical protein